jgi:transposase InsO family protein
MAAAYLAFPAVQWAAIWHFHPETLAADAGIQPSMGSVGDSLDNALAENFFSILKVERIYRTSYRTGRRPSLTCSATSTAGTTPTASNASLAG